MTTYQIIAKEWFDKVNGNSYFSAQVFNDNKLVGSIPTQYGYGDTYRHEALKLLEEL